MKTIKFTYYPEYGGYKCSEPGEGTGVYVLLTEAEAEITQLKEWKESALEVESRWDCQAVGRLLGVKWGGDIRSKIQPGIESLQAEIAALRDSLEISKQAGAELAKSCGNLHERQRVLVDTLRELRDAVKSSGKMNGKEYDGLGIKVNAALAAKEG